MGKTLVVGLDFEEEEKKGGDSKNVALAEVKSLYKVGE